MTELPSRGRLELSSSDLVRALRVVAAAHVVRRGRSRPTPLAFSFNGTDLELGCGQTTVTLPAKGTWPHVAVAGTRLVGDLLKREMLLPKDLVLLGTETQLHFDHYTARCSWSA